MFQLTFYFLIVITSTYAGTLPLDLNCSKNGTSVIFVNGIMNEYEEAFLSRKQITNLEIDTTNAISVIDKKDMFRGEPSEVILSYNFSRKNILEDLMESQVQLTESRY